LITKGENKAMPEQPVLEPERTAEEARLDEAREKEVPWKQWGPYLSERQWGTVREDYSENGDAWNYFTHDQARSRAYHWGLLELSNSHGTRGSLQGFEGGTPTGPPFSDLAPFLDTYRTMCLAPKREFQQLLEQIRDLPSAA
jgi:hypothetical protein